MRSRWFVVVALAAVTLVAGCTAAVGGTARRAPGPTPRSLTGQAIERVLLGNRTLSQILKQPLNLDPRFPPRFGGPEELQDDALGSPADCLGVAAMLQHSVYQFARVTNVAVETWRHKAASAEVTSVKEAVVSVPTAADADALFASFSRQWQKCDGAAMSLPGSIFRLQGKITDVHVATSLLAATVSIGWTSARPDSASIPAGRAIGVRGNCLIEVEVDFFHPSNPSRGPGDIDNTATDVAHSMMDRVSALI